MNGFRQEIRGVLSEMRLRRMWACLCCIIVFSVTSATSTPPTEAPPPSTQPPTPTSGWYPAPGGWWYPAETRPYYCGMGCRRWIGPRYSTEMHDHMVRHHQADPSMINNPAQPGGRYRCKDCQYQTPFLFAYERHEGRGQNHRARCRDGDTFKCDLCPDYQAITAEELLHHLMEKHARPLVSPPASMDYEEAVRINTDRRQSPSTFYNDFGKPFLPALSIRGLTAGLWRRMNAHLTNPNVEVQRPNLELCGRRERPHVEQWPSINVGNFRKVAVCRTRGWTTTKTAEQSQQAHDGGNTEGVDQQEDIWIDSSEDEGMPELVSSSDEDQADREDFCYVEADEQSMDFGEVVCLDMSGHHQTQQAVDLQVVGQEINHAEINEPANEGEPEAEQPEGHQTTTWMPPLIDEGRSWFSSTQPPPGTGQFGLGGLAPLGGILCVYSMTQTRHHRAHRARRAMRVRPAAWDQSFDNEEEVFEFWLAFARRLDLALQAYRRTGAFPRLLWHCSVIRSKALAPFHKGADATLPELINGLPSRPAEYRHTETK